MGPDGLDFSQIAYGTWRILDVEPKASVEALRSSLELCLELGLTTLDTAEIYGGYQVEAFLGKTLASSASFRDQFEIVTKCGIDVPSDEKSGVQTNHYRATAENLQRCAEKSLRLLGVDCIDLFLVHRPDWLTPADETAAGLEKLIQAGKIRQAGVSNYTVSQFDLLNSRMDHPLATNQVEVSLLCMDAIYDGTLNQCEQHRIAPMAWSPLAGGGVFSKDNEAATRVRECMDGMRERYDGAAYDALAFAWVMALPSRPVPVIGTNDPDRIRSTVQAVDLSLAREDWYALWEAAKGCSVP